MSPRRPHPGRRENVRTAAKPSITGTRRHTEKKLPSGWATEFKVTYERQAKHENLLERNRWAILERSWCASQLSDTNVMNLSGDRHTLRP